MVCLGRSVGRYELQRVCFPELYALQTQNAFTRRRHAYAAAYCISGVPWRGGHDGTELTMAIIRLLTLG